MPSYLVETYLARGETGQRLAREQRARLAAEKLTHGRRRVSVMCSFNVPEDEVCFFLVDAPSERDATLVAQRAELDPIRVVEAISSGKEKR